MVQTRKKALKARYDTVCSNLQTKNQIVFSNKKLVGHGWQIRIAIHPDSLREDNPDNKIEQIRTILDKLLNDRINPYCVDAKLAIFPNQACFESDCDGAMSQQGLDRDNCGKEICIYVPNTEFQELVSIKPMLLTLWRQLQEAEVPLLYLTPPGDRKIFGPNHLPTPFSFTSIGPEEKYDDHGILLKEFVGYDNKHLLLKLSFTAQDLKKANISFHAGTSRQQLFDLREYYSCHQRRAFLKLQEDINLIIDKPSSYTTLLFDNQLKEKLKIRVQDYHEQCQALLAAEDKNEEEKIDARAGLARDFNAILQQDQDLQHLINQYPRNKDTVLSLYLSLERLNQLTSLQEKEIDDIFEQARKNYDTKLRSIEEDFLRHSDPSKKLEYLTINWLDYDLDHLSQCIVQDPAQMQIIYRRIVCLEREKCEQDIFELNWLQSFFNNDCIAAFADQIKALKENKDYLIEDVVDGFQNLYQALKEDLFIHTQCDLKKTVYPATILHFTELASQVNTACLAARAQGEEKAVISMEEIKKSMLLLNKRLLDKQPMSGTLKGAIHMVFYVLAGLAAGFVIGAALGAAATCWSGGFGALPGAILGSVTGFTVATQGGIVGSVFSAGISTIFGIPSFFQAKDKEREYHHDFDSVKGMATNFEQQLSGVKSRERTIQ